MDTVWVWGDQLNRDLAHLRDADPAATRVLMVVSTDKLAERRWHVQKAHLVVSAIRHFAAELEDAGFEVDLRRAASMRAGFAAHVDEFDPGTVRAMEPASLPGSRLLDDLDVEVVDNDHFLCHWRAFDAWADGRTHLKMEDFYRLRRQQTGYLMDGEQPAGGRWNHDHANREPPTRELIETAPDPVTSRLDEIDRDTLDNWLPNGLYGAPPDGTWATTRRRALARLRRFVDEALPAFGAHQDAMVAGAWSLNHALLSHALNLGLLHPTEVCDAVEEAYRDGRVPINAAEGFIRQIIGWREYIWGVYRRWMPEYADLNELGADLAVPPAFTGGAGTDLRCVADTVATIHDHAYAHHIQRLMVLANLATSAGVDPQAFTAWMHGAFIDAYDWVMVPNVIGMGTFADGGKMSTKPYISGGAYISRMSTGYCNDCRFDPKQRVGETACPFTTLYWDMLDRNRDVLTGNHRLNQPYATLDRLTDLEEVRERATEVRRRLAAGDL
ncbi:MAG: cryptochrome/photolyase family protein [Nitriliruptor sp.]|nr:MAG: cryptochrome/photolyase family protein [Nitriliruptor sp.]